MRTAAAHASSSVSPPSVRGHLSGFARGPRVWAEIEPHRRTRYQRETQLAAYPTAPILRLPTRERLRPGGTGLRRLGDFSPSLLGREAVCNVPRP